ncbi:MAG: hypothetical protein OXU20_39380, partial [Myxococcales bacterium]|nr:hypothetical protein [Myxococcales bacterium]
MNLRICVAFLACAVVLGQALPVLAFPPHDYMSGFGLIGRSHEAQTRAAIQRIARDTFGQSTTCDRACQRRQNNPSSAIVTIV